MITIKHHGATSGVTGSCHELVLDKQSSVLIDCGMFQGEEASGTESDNLKLDFPVSNVKALFITHCHIDHVGRIPSLMAAGFNGPVYASKATARLLPLVLEDALKIGVTRNATLIRQFLNLLSQQVQPVEYKQWHPVESVEGLRFRFKPAGHILGSAYIEFECSVDNTKEIILFSGDLGAPYAPLLPAPQAPWRADRLIIESTYGDKLHENRRNRRKQLENIIAHCLQDAGTVLIPAFSIGRTQELLYELEDIIHRQKGTAWENIDVIVDSPLAAKFTQHYRELSTLWDAEAKTRKQHGRHPLAFEQLITIDSHSQHLKLVNYLKSSGRPAIVIAASGMCAGGRIVNYLKALLPDPRTEVLFVGYQAKGTPGHDIQKYGPAGGYVYLDNEKIDIRAGVYTISGYSAHADQKDLISFVKRMRYKPKEIRIVHGDKEAKRVLKAELKKITPETEIIIP
ncbi:MBL fold metallo-hydrolase RNA specificity domain-containing protein [Amphritea pacifica]|uniref:MBL fold metallo-hydrolase RNA specificity domain-containing protein n=1 Tax=Amphritea pacifica TaxID=2811233 RepID=UPI0019654ECD|nr:MBL fold metallo-hydrolase [Amphritea pacifica]MBN1008725.1 MBL fold metallo-hydrolase [Amphritea pacifica]